MKCPEQGGHLVFLPWAREGSCFNLLYDALVMVMVGEMPIKTMAQLFGEICQHFWRVIDYYVKMTRSTLPALSDVYSVGMDETSSHRGHDYTTHFADLLAKPLPFATPGTDAQTIVCFASSVTKTLAIQNHYQGPPSLTNGRKQPRPAITVLWIRVSSPSWVTRGANLCWFDRHITGGILEGSYSQLQVAKSKARGLTHR